MMNRKTPMNLKAPIVGIVFGLWLTLHATVAMSEISWPASEDAQQSVQKAVTLIKDLRALVPLPAADMSERADQLDFDFDQAVEFVKTDIRYEPYTGVLRGAEGTAQSGAGNSWDQALLLASLIRTMGGDAQLVQGQLTNADAARLLQEAFVVPPQSTDAEPDLKAMTALLNAFDPDVAEDATEAWNQAHDDNGKSADLTTQSRHIAKQLLDLIEASTGSRLAGDAATQVLDDVANDYVWIRWRLGANTDWVDLHPAFGSRPAPDLEPRHWINDSVPEKFLHRVSFQLFIEKGIDGGAEPAELIPVMERWERPVANLYHDQINLGMGPQSIDGGGAGTVLVPMLNGALAPGAKAVTRLGLTADPGDAASPAGSFFSTLSSQLGEVSGAVGDLEGTGSETVPRLLGTMLRVELISPRDTRTINRRVANLRGEPGEDFPLSGAFDMVLDVHIGAQDPRLLTHHMFSYYANLIQATPPMLALARDVITPDELKKVSAYRDLETPRWLDFEFAAPAMITPFSEDQVMFRNGPLLAALRTTANPSEGIITVTDILWNPSTVLRREGSAFTVHPDESVVQGVRETVLESGLARTDEGWSQRPPANLISNVEELNKSAVVATWSTGARERLRADVEQGNLVALTGSEPHWWRVDPTNGQTLGMGEHGGSEFVEYLVMIGGAALSTYLFARSVDSCDEAYPDNRDMADCCIVGNLAATYLTAGAGGTLTSAAAKPWEAAAGALKTGVQGAAVEVGGNIVSGVVTEVGIGPACRAHLNNSSGG